MKHTPGPWERAFDDGGAIVIEAGEVRIATVEDDGGVVGGDEANARLIAVAPTIVELLQRLLPEAPKRNADGTVVYTCKDCGWEGTEGEMAATDGPDDLGPGEAKPVGACPNYPRGTDERQCRWWFSSHEAVVLKESDLVPLRDAIKGLG